MLDASGKVCCLFSSSYLKCRYGVWRQSGHGGKSRPKDGKANRAGTWDTGCLGGCIFQPGVHEEGLPAGLRSELRTDRDEAILLGSLE